MGDFSVFFCMKITFIKIEILQDACIVMRL
jgi:hypothetical protein